MIQARCAGSFIFANKYLGLAPRLYAIACFAGLSRSLFFFLNTKMHAAAHNLLERDARRLVFLRINLDSGLRATLQLLAALRGEDYQTVFRINFRPPSSVNFLINQICHSNAPSLMIL
jgi:hypothetical protein